MIFKLILVNYQPIVGIRKQYFFFIRGKARFVTFSARTWTSKSITDLTLCWHYRITIPNSFLIFSFQMTTLWWWYVLIWIRWVASMNHRENVLISIIPNSLKSLSVAEYLLFFFIFLVSTTGSMSQSDSHIKTRDQNMWKTKKTRGFNCN